MGFGLLERLCSCGCMLVKVDRGGSFRIVEWEGLSERGLIITSIVEG